MDSLNEQLTSIIYEYTTMEQYNKRMKLIGKYFDCTVHLESIFNIKERNSLLQALKEATKSIEKFQMKYNKGKIVTI